MSRAVLAAATFLLLCGCGDGQDPVDEDANKIETPAARTPATNATGGAGSPPAEPPAAAEARRPVPGAQASGPPIPAPLHGRWGLTPADCAARSPQQEGLLVVSARELQFYESSARPLPGLQASADSAAGDFAYTGEGMQWTRNLTLGLSGDELTLTQSRPAQTFTYVRCR